MASELLALAERIEKATGPDRWLESEIWRVVNGWPEEDGERFEDRTTAPAPWWRRDPNDRVAFECAPEFTASIDAALTLVPQGWRFSVDNLNRAGPLAICEPDRGAYVRAEATTPALALCAAALRALASAPGGQGDGE
jgi:hypothetical protein